MPETGIKQMQGGVLHTAVVPVNRQPVIERFFGASASFVMRIAIAHEVPGRAGPLRHGIGFPFCRTAAMRTGRIDKGIHRCKRGFSVISRFIGIYFRQFQRKFAFRQRNPAAFFTVNHRDRFSPVSLTGEHPVAQLKVDLWTSLPGLFQKAQ